MKKWSTRKWSGVTLCIQRDKQIKKLNKGSHESRERSHPTMFLTCKKELKEGLELGLVVHTFNSSTKKAEAGRSLSLRIPWSIE